MARKAYNLEMAMEKPEEVEELSIVNRNLTQFPKQIFQLKNLKSLDLSSNQLVGIPGSINDLRNLRELNLASNLLTEFSFVNLKLNNLRLIDIGNNQISFLPKTVFYNKNLEYLRIGLNQLRAISSDISTLKKLKELDLSFNQLRKLPNSFVELEKLEVLSLTSNPIQNLPANFERLNALEKIQIDIGNSFNTDALDLQLKSIKELYLKGNKRTEIPEKIYQLKKLKSLFLTEFYVKNLSPNIGNLENLSFLGLSTIPILTLPENIQKLENLVQLAIYHSRIKKIPLSILRLKKLRNFHADKKLKPLDVSKFLKEIRKQELPDFLENAAFQFLFHKENSLDKLSKRNLLKLSRFSSQKLMTGITNTLYKTHSLSSESYPIRRETDLALIGKTNLKLQKVKAHLKNISKKITPQTTHVILGKFTGEIESLASRDFVFVRENELNLWLQKQENPYLLNSSEAEIENLSRLLLSLQNENIDIALQIMETGGVPEILLTDLIIVFKKLPASKQKRAIRKLLSLHLSEKALKVVSLKTGLLKAEDLEKKILELTNETVLDGLKISKYLTTDKK